MTILNFPADTSQSPYEENGIIYVWDGQAWITDGGTEQFVPITGGTITGDLTVEGDATVGSLNGGPLAGFRNHVINGGMDIWQRGITGYTHGGADISYQSVDRWGTMSQSVDSLEAASTVPRGFTFSASIGIGASVRHRIELPNNKAGVFFSGAQFTLSVWSTHVIQARVQNVAGTSLPIQDLTSTGETSNGFTRYSATFNIVADSTGDFVEIALINNSGSLLRFTGVQLEPGPVATPFEHRPIGTELALCQRYYQRINLEGAVYNGATNSANTAWIHASLATPMRINDPAFEVAAGGIDLNVTTGRLLISGGAPIQTTINMVSNCSSSDATVQVNRNGSGDNFVGMTVCYNNDRNQARINLDAEL